MACPVPTELVAEHLYDPWSLLLADLTVKEEAVVEVAREYLEVEAEIAVTLPLLEVKVHEIDADGLADTKQLKVTSPLVKTL